MKASYKAQVVNCCVYEIPKQFRKRMTVNNQICLTISRHEPLAVALYQMDTYIHTQSC